MSNQIATLCKNDVRKYIKDESENINIIRQHVELLKEAQSCRSIHRLFEFDDEPADSPNIAEIKKSIFERCKFDFADSIEESLVSLIEDADKLSDVENDIIEVFEGLDSSQQRDFAIMLSLLDGGQEVITKNQLIDLKKIGLPVRFHCPICESDSEIKLSILAIAEGYTVKSACKSCGHTEAPKKGCKCEFCKKNQVTFDLAKVVESGFHRTKSAANKMLNKAIEREELVQNDVDLLNRFAKFMSFRGSLSADAQEVVEKAIEVFSVTGAFDHNTYYFTQNIVGEEKASAIASELNKVGFFYKVGFIPRNNSLGIPPSFGIDSKHLQCMKINTNGVLSFYDDIKPTTDDSDSVLIINKGFSDDFHVHFEVQPYMRGVFKVNHLVLEHEVFGGIVSTKETEEKTEDGAILKTVAVREAFLREIESGEYFVFPDIRIGRLIDLDDFRKIMISSTLSLLEGFEANLVCYDKQFNPKKVYINKTSQSLDVVKNSVVPILKSKGIEVILL